MSRLYYARPSSYFGSTYDNIVLHSLLNLKPFILINPETDTLSKYNELYDSNKPMSIYYLTHSNGKLGLDVANTIEFSVLIHGENADIKEIDWNELFLNRQCVINDGDWKDREVLGLWETKEQLERDFKEIVS